MQGEQIRIIKYNILYYFILLLYTGISNGVDAVESFKGDLCYAIRVIE